MKLWRSSTLLMLCSAGLWALVPVVLAISADGSMAALAFTAWFNLVGALLCLVVWVLVSDVPQRRADVDVSRAYLTRQRGWIPMLAGGLGIAVSNAAFFKALTFSEDAVVTLIVEGWPVLAAVLLGVVVKQFSGISRREWYWIAVAVVGFYFVVVSRDGALISGLPGLAIALAVLSAATQAGAVIAHQVVLQAVEHHRSRSKIWLLQAVRMAGASAISFLLAAASGQMVWPTPAQWPFISAVAVLITASAILYHLALHYAKMAITAMLWFLTPVVSIALLQALDLGQVSGTGWVGATLIITANIFLQEKLESSINVVGLVVPTLVLGFLVIYVEGRAVEDYFEYVSIIAAFYGILQGFLLSRLWDRRTRIAILEHAGALWAERQPAGEPVDLDRRERDVIHDEAELVVLRREVKSFSEAILLTILGVAACGVIVYGRAASFTGDVIGFLIPISIAYLLTISWSLIRGVPYSDLRIVGTDQVADAAMSYLLVVAVFVSMLLAIAAAH